MTDDRLAGRLRGIFLQELDEQRRLMCADVLELESAPEDAARLNSLFRAAHTLKGAARAAGVPEIEKACEAVETLLAQARAGALTLGPADFTMLFATVDALDDAAERLRRGEALHDTPVAGLPHRAGGADPRRRDAAEAPAHGAGPEAAVARQNPAAAQEPPVPSVPVERGAAVRPVEQLRVETERVDALLASAGELLIASRRLTDRPRRVRELQEMTGRCMADFRRLTRRPGRGIDDPAAMALATSLEGALGTLLTQVRELAGDSERETRLLDRLGSDVGRTMRHLRMRPFADATEHLPRVVRDVAATGNKEVRLEIVGSEVAADRAVLDVVREALLHLVRNAVDHGIEPPQVRLERKKPVIGTVRVAAHLRGDRLVVDVEDDGAGLNEDAIRQHLERAGRPVPESQDELASALFEPGMSTLDHATAISGRGVGLDAVRSAVERVRGRVDVSWTAGEATRFTLDCPLSLAALRALLVRVGDQILAVPTADVERLMRLDPDQIVRMDGRDVLPGPDGPVPLVSLAAALGPPLAPLQIESRIPVAQLRAGGRRLAVAVDELLSEQEVIVRAADPLPVRPQHLAGLALLGSGRLALVVEGAALIRLGIDAQGVAIATQRVQATAPAKQTILVADDSITTRTLEGSILEAAGYRVLTAADGLEAWRTVQEQGCDLVVSDVEMPRMDGFQLCAAIRESEPLSTLPVILVTGLESPEDRARGFEAGADAYLQKSSFDQQHLLDTIARLIG